jgi:L-aminopeptidase/D-esterase-like protein
MIAFSTANREKLASYKVDQPPDAVDVTMLPDGAITELFWATIEATEEAILNALVAAERGGPAGSPPRPTTTRFEVIIAYGRGPGAPAEVPLSRARRGRSPRDP